MPKQIFRLTMGLETLSLIFVVIGLILVMSSCRSNKIVTDTVKEHTETSDTIITHENKIVDVEIKGEKSEAKGDSIDIAVNDSVPALFNNPCTDRIDTIYVKPSNDVRHYTITIAPVFAFGDYGYAKGWVDNNVLNVHLEIYDKVIQTEIKDAITKINIKQVIKDTEKVTIEKTKKDMLGRMIPIAALLIVVTWVLTSLSYRGS